jgi:hypothetical protein
MRYVVPELSLVGAAKNLVLNGCDLVGASDFNPVYASCRYDGCCGGEFTLYADVLPF